MTILEIRERLGLSRKEFGAKFHLTTRAITSWEEGWRNTPDHILFMVQRILELEEQVALLRGSVEDMGE